MVAIIFDLDGVLVNSMPSHVRAWQQAFKEVAGLEVSDRDFYLLEGMRGMELIKKILGREDEILAKKIQSEKDRVFRSIRSSAPFEGVRSMLERTAGNRAVVSGSAKEDVQTILKEAFGDGKFSAILTADDIERGKPDPSAFLEAAKRLGVEPTEIVVVENAPLGAIAARNAQMQCYIALNNTPLVKPDFAGATSPEKIFDTTFSVLKYLEREHG